MTGLFRTSLICFSAILCCSSVDGQMFIDEATPLGIVSLITADEYGSGVSVHDFNQDGLDDITFSSSSGNLKLYQNNGDGFDLINPGLYSPGWTKQVLWVDYDNDGDLDMFLTTYNNVPKLYKNTGGFAFDDATASSGLPTAPSYSAGASFADYDKDGFLDLYICTYADSNFTPINALSYNKLYRNLGNGTFENVTESSGMETPLALSFQSVWLDYNNDGWPDLYVINDRIYGNTLHLNNGDGTFTDVTETSETAYPNNDVMSNSVADFDNDGDLDIFMTNTGSFVPPRPTLLSQNQGDGTFDEVGALYNLDTYYNSWGAVWIDADNDGWQDLYFTTSDNTANYFFINDQGSLFIDANDEIGVLGNNPCWSVAKGDFNNDGFADMAVQSRTPHRPNVLLNQGEDNHYIKISLSGTVSNSMAISSWVHVYHDGAFYHQYTTCGNNYLSQDSQHLIFGLGANDNPVDSIEIVYLSGHTDMYYELAVDSSYEFTEGETYVVNISSGGTAAFCEGDTLVLEAGIHDNFLWSTGDTTATISITAPGAYSVSVSNPYGISATDSIDIGMYPSPVIGFDLIPISCNGDSTGGISLYNLSEIESANVTWNNGALGDTITGLTDGTYTYLFEDINGCFAEGEITLGEPPFIAVLATVNNATTGLNNGSIFINAFGGTPPYVFYLDSVEVGSYINNLAPETYDLEVYDDNLCRDYQEVEIESVLSTGRAGKALFKMFPNPAHDHITVHSELQIESIEILDMSGKRIWSQKANPVGNYEFGQLAAGMYLVRLALENGQVQIQKLGVLE